MGFSCEHDMRGLFPEICCKSARYHTTAQRFVCLFHHSCLCAYLSCLCLQVSCGIVAPCGWPSVIGSPPLTSISKWVGVFSLMENPSLLTVNYVKQGKYARSGRFSNPFGRSQRHLWVLLRCNLCPPIVRLPSKVASPKCWECSQNLSLVCKWHSWQANCKDFLLSAQNYAFTAVFVFRILYGCPAE